MVIWKLCRSKFHAIIVVKYFETDEDSTNRFTGRPTINCMRCNNFPSRAELNVGNHPSAQLSKRSLLILDPSALDNQVDSQNSENNAHV